MFYLTTHSTHFILRLYGIRHMVNDHSDSEKGNPLPPHRLLFPINSKSSFICTIPQTGQLIPRPLLHESWSGGWNGKRPVRGTLSSLSLHCLQSRLCSISSLPRAHSSWMSHLWRNFWARWSKRSNLHEGTHTSHRLTDREREREKCFI